jgi:hypothetical protein
MRGPRGRTSAVAALDREQHDPLVVVGDERRPRRPVVHRESLDLVPRHVVPAVAVDDLDALLTCHDDAAADAVQQHQHRHDDDPQRDGLGRREVDLVGEREGDHRREHQHDDRDGVGHDARTAGAEGPLVGHDVLRSGTRGCP